MSMQLIAASFGVLSSAHKEWESEVSSGIAQRDALVFAAEGERELTGQVPGLEAVKRIRNRVIRLAQANASEAAWNSGVHDFLLDYALRDSTFKTLSWENITTARIWPSSMLRSWSVADSSKSEVTDPPRESKRVDFCITIDDDAIALGRKLVARRVHQLNHTDYGAVRFTPITVRIETKAGNEAGADATLQLTTWVTAQHAYLRTLLDRSDRLAVMVPALPLIMIQGHAWHFYYMQFTGELRTLWYSSDAFGTTSTTLGIYRIIAGLQRLMQWAATEYNPWFQTNIIQPLTSEEPANT